MVMEKEKMSVMGEMPDWVTGASHDWKRSETDLMGIPTGTVISYYSHYLSGHDLFFSLLAE